MLPFSLPQPPICPGLWGCFLFPRKTNFPRAPRVPSPDAPRPRHNGPSASDTQSRPEKPRPQPPQPFRLWSLPQTTHLPRTLGVLPFFPSQSGLKTGPEIDEKNELSTSTSRSFARCAAIPAPWPVHEQHAIPPRKTEAPAAPTFPALVSPANHPSAQDFWDASFFFLLRTFGMLPFSYPALPFSYPANHPSAQDFWDASFFLRDPGTMARPRATRNPAQKNRGPSRPNLSGFSLSRKPPICLGLLGCFLVWAGNR
jgi:hypothetical protein